MAGLDGKKIKKSTITMYDEKFNRVLKESYAVHIQIREEYEDGTFNEVWGTIDKEEAFPQL